MAFQDPPKVFEGGRYCLRRHPVAVVLHRYALYTLEGVAFDDHLDVHRFRIEGVPDQLDDCLHWVVPMSEPQHQVVLGVDVQPLHEGSLP